MNKTEIEWCDMTWNPVTGCLHGCPYCYAEKIAKRFKMKNEVDLETLFTSLYRSDGLLELGYPIRSDVGLNKTKIEPYPHGFMPTFHSYRLADPQRVKKSQNIFVCSMADLFGDWVPDDWIQTVFDACKKAPQHRYLFLTKNPDRYVELGRKGILHRSDNFWLGSTLTKETDMFLLSSQYKTYVSIEPILEEFTFSERNPVKNVEWVILGAETGNRKGKVKPERTWIEEIVQNCKEVWTPVFMKNSLTRIWGKPLIQEFPWRKDRT